MAKLFYVSVIIFFSFQIRAEDLRFFISEEDGNQVWITKPTELACLSKSIKAFVTDKKNIETQKTPASGYEIVKKFVPLKPKIPEIMKSCNLDNLAAIGLEKKTDLKIEDIKYIVTEKDDDCHYPAPRLEVYFSPIVGNSSVVIVQISMCQ